MTTRSRAGHLLAAASIALTGAALAVSVTPAAAAAPAISIQSVSSDTVPSGGSVRVRFRATNNNERTEKVFVAVSGGLRCTAGCSAAPDIGPGRSRTFEATVVAPEVRSGEQSGLNLAVSVRIGTQTAFDHQMILVGGAKKPPSAVSRISGRVRDADGKAIRGATLTVRDSAGHTYRTTSDGSGRFSIRSSGSKPIVTGPLAVVAAKDGYRTARATVRGAAGDTATARLVLAAVATPATTPPSPTAAASPPAATEEPATESFPAAAPPATTGTTDDPGNGLLLFTLLGGLLIAAGLGALVLVFARRRKRHEPDPPASGSGILADAPTAILRTVPPDALMSAQAVTRRDPREYGYGGPAR
ncbi:carboxypeptidase-like regulatory domain-containing protein [Paractinoplanes hotanensis]|uniref:Carboxypeptidase-like regulatory domain-containing protein n=1 Tax=Paractinoplanes hotanensis TaxID=2906497 RepID=A0ABT0XW22_9ACTN|nr:carboxypeptidase-like regulatory domain-containing protein [Actinoplanes hotanensis]MCM4077992.1 carboxypeptidase-like regulatory domain-containing protein [Actinoplanes hotanensis]